MKSLIFVLVALFSMNVFADPVCDFPYDLSEEEGVRDLRTVVVTENTRLTSLQQTQIIITAKHYSERVPRTMTIKTAIKSLMSNSEGGDLYYRVFKFKNVVYSIVEHYPGGNAFGLVFKGTEIVAERTDGDMNCTGF
jgi:uncharacterized Fe-S cluster-containing radical SAM superfamily enzyme